MDLSLTKLNYLVTIARVQNFSRAAEILHVSQPALSRAVAAMERDYGIRLFERGRFGTQPTVAGAHIIAEAEEVLRQANTFHHNSRMIARGERGDVSFGLAPALANAMLAELASRMLARRPGLNLDAMIRRTDVLARYLVTEAIEFFVSVQEHVALPVGIETQHVGYVYGGFYVRSGHPLCARGKLKLRDIFAYPLASVRQSTLHQRCGLHAGSFVCDNFTLIHELVRMSDVVGISTRRTAAGEIAAGRLTLLEAEDFTFQPSEVVVGRIAGRAMSPVASEIVQYCRNWLETTE
jgi:DNA-binding transcriptional LysR family regulator